MRTPRATAPCQDATSISVVEKNEMLFKAWKATQSTYLFLPSYNIVRAWNLLMTLLLMLMLFTVPLGKQVRFDAITCPLTLPQASQALSITKESRFKSRLS
jgi:hypothetical protein